jgi:hypothetical protein
MDAINYVDRFRSDFCLLPFIYKKRAPANATLLVCVCPPLKLSESVGSIFHETCQDYATEGQANDILWNDTSAADDGPQ